MTATNTTSALKQITGTIVLVGAGKMGGAMLTGWLARAGSSRSRVAVIDPHPPPNQRAAADAFASLRRRMISATSRGWWSR